MPDLILHMDGEEKIKKKKKKKKKEKKRTKVYIKCLRIQQRSRNEM